MATQKQKQEFLDNIAPIIVKVSRERGYKYPGAIIAQAALESGWNTSSLSKKYNNFWGMKCGSKYTGKSVNLATKEEYTKGTLTSIKANFRAYDSVDEGIHGYFNFIESMSRYSNLKSAKSAINYFELLKADGWATSSTYVKNLTTTYNANNFAKYDDAGYIAETNTVNTNPLKSLGLYRVTATELNVRLGAGTKYGTVTRYVKGEVVDVKEIRGNWAKTNIGFCHMNYLQKV